MRNSESYKISVRKTTLFFFLFCLSQNFFAQTVGLVLSGGGAKGLAHVGVIKALEENNIPISYVAGTSIGAIVGGLYAMGYSPAEMEEFFKSEEFHLWSKGELNYDQIFYFKRKEIDPSWIELRFSSEDSVFKPVLPTNIIPPHQMNIAFMQLCSSSSAAARYDFNNLFVPYRCVATNANEKKLQIFRNGDLGQAIRASMTFPLYFKPIEINGNLMFDGGMFDNFPVKTMIEDFNPDIIIGVKVSENSTPPKADNLLSQVESMMTQTTNFDILKPGILIEPDIKTLGLLEFEKWQQAIDSGYYATIRVIDSIKKLTTARISVEQLTLKRLEFNKKKPPLVFQDIYIHGLKKNEKEYILRSIIRKQEKISIHQFIESYYKLLSDDFIQSILPLALYDTASGFFDLHLYVTKDNKFMTNFGGIISSSTVNEGFINTRLKYLSSKTYLLTANMYFGRFYNSGQLFGRIDIPALYRGYLKTFFPYYIESSVTYNNWDYYRGNSDFLYQDSRPAYLIQNETYFRFNIGFPLGMHGKIVTGTSVGETNDKYYFTNSVNKNDIPDHTQFLLHSYHITIEHSNEKMKQFANQGGFRKIQARYVNGSEKYLPGTTSLLTELPWTPHSWWQLRFLVSHLFKIKKPFSLGGRIEGMYSTQPFFNNYISTLLSAPYFAPTPHSQTIFIEQFRAHHFLAGGIYSVFTLAKNLDLRLEGYLFYPYQKIKYDELHASYAIPLKHKYLCIGATIVYNTFIGPASISFNYYEKTGNRYYLSFNFGYLLFNNRILD